MATDLIPGHRNILFLMSGSIACAKATGLISAWRKAGHAVRVAATASVSEFVGRATLEGLSGEPVFDDTFAPGRAMDHIELARWADLVVACPASANLLAKFAHGIADDAVSTLWQAAWSRGAPQFVVPAMNTHMWDYPATRENVERLKRWGIHVLPTAAGDLACGETGAGRMLEPDDIRARIEGLLAHDRTVAGRVLITGGGTREPIDAVRFIGNHSTGRTAAVLADALADRGFDVTWLGGAVAQAPEAVEDLERYESFSDLEAALRRRLETESFDAVIHAAAVSDFSVAGIDGNDPGAAPSHGSPVGAGKIGSGSAMTLHLAPNPKLLPQLRGWSRNPALRVVGFKLTVAADEAGVNRAVQRLFAGDACDLVVHNDLAEIGPARHAYTLIDAGGSRQAADDTRALATLLADALATTPIGPRADDAPLRQAEARET